jgi:hypothetical protein
MKNNYKRQYSSNKLEDVIITIKNFEKDSITQSRLENNKANIMSNIRTEKIIHNKPFFKNFALVASIAFVILFSGILPFINKNNSNIPIKDNKDMNITDFVIGDIFSSLYNNDYDESNLYAETENWLNYDEIRHNFDISFNIIPNIDFKNISLKELDTENVSYIDVIMSDYKTSFDFIDAF